MKVAAQKLSKTFRRFTESERSGGMLLIFCTFLSIIAANSTFGNDYLKLWHVDLAGLSIDHWVNDALMAVFFLLIGLELERELYNGELSNFKTALLPAIAALGGVMLPAAIHYFMNAGTATQAGIGVPMATDIAFSLGVLALLGSLVPSSLKVFLVAFAVMDDLFAIVVIAVFYTAKLSMLYLAAALGVWFLLVALNRFFKVRSLIPYLLGGALMWYFMLINSTLATLKK